MGQRTIACPDLEGARDSAIAEGLGRFLVDYAPQLLFHSIFSYHRCNFSFSLPLWTISCNFTAGIPSIVVCALLSLLQVLEC